MVLVDRSQVSHEADGVKRLLKEISFFRPWIMLIGLCRL